MTIFEKMYYSYVCETVLKAAIYDTGENNPPFEVMETPSMVVSPGPGWG